MLGLTSEKNVTAAGKAASGGMPVLLPVGSSHQQPPYALDRRCVLVGASETADLQLFFGGVNEAHALIITTAAGIYVRSLAGREGVCINGLPMTEHFLGDCDEVQFGQFAFSFRAGQNHSQPRTPPPHLEIEVVGEGVKQIHGRVCVVGAGPGPWSADDISLRQSDANELFAALFVADGTWHIRELTPAAEVSVNDKTVSLAELSVGDRVSISGRELRIAGLVQPRPATPSAFIDVPLSDAFLGGMPVSLPEVGPPKGFGTVNISFGGKSFASKRPPATPVAPQPDPEPDPEPEIAEAHEPPAAPSPQSKPQPKAEATVAVATPPVSVPAVEPVAPAAPAKPAYRVPPRIKLPKPAEPEAMEEEPPAPDTAVLHPDIFGMGGLEEIDEDGEHAIGYEDAGFGGAPLAGGVEQYIPDPLNSPDAFSVEIENFADNEFWNQSEEDSSAVSLPEREKDYAPTIPPLERAGGASVPTSFTPSQDRTFEPRLRSAPGERTVPPEFRRRDGSPLATNTTPVHRPRLSRRMRVGLAGLSAAAAVSAAIWLLVPAHWTLEARLKFMHTPAASTQEWKDFQSDQLNRLADATLPEAATAKLQVDHPETGAGFIGEGNSSEFNRVIHSAAFSNSDAGSELVLRFSGTDWSGDGARLTAVLKALYDRENDLVSAAAAARQALSDWQPSIGVKQSELDETLRRIATEQKLIDAARGLPEQVGPLLTQAALAGKKYLAVEKTMQKDQEAFAELQARLAVPTVAATQPTMQNSNYAELVKSTGDDLLSELSDRIDQLTEQINAVGALSLEDSSNASTRPAKKTATPLELAQRNLDHDLTDGQKAFADHPDLQQALSATGELQTRVRDLISQLAERRAQTVSELGSLANLLDETGRRRQEIFTQARNTAMKEARRQTDATAHLRNTLSHLIDGAQKQLENQRQMIEITLQTQQERLSAAGTPEDLSAPQRTLLSKVVQEVSDLTQLQSDYGKSLALLDLTVQTLPAVQDELDDTREQAASRRLVLAAKAEKDQTLRDKLSAQSDQLSRRLDADLTDMIAARADFSARSATAFTALSTVQAAHDAGQAMGVLLETRDAKQGDLTAVQRASDDLQQKINSTVDIKPPSESDVRIILDDTGRKWTYLLGSWIAIGVVTMGMARKA